MKHKDGLKRLSGLAKLILDQRLAKLHACAAERNASLQRLQDLAPKISEEIGMISQATTLLRYETWADARRREINLLLARQTVAWLDARTEAQVALGRADVLNRLEKNKSAESKKA